MIHQRERLPFSLKSGHDTFGVHSRFDDFQGDPAPNRLLLFGHINYAAAALADLLQQFIPANSITHILAGRSSRLGFYNRFGRGFLQKIASLIVGFQQPLDPLAQFLVSAASTFQVSGALAGRQLEGFRKDHHIATGRIVHEIMRITLIDGCSVLNAFLRKCHLAKEHGLPDPVYKDPRLSAWLISLSI
jgi:hypothetical protein